MVGEWENGALCAQVSPDWWINEDDGPASLRATRVCQACPVRAACRVASVMEPAGMWAGVKTLARNGQRRRAGIRKDLEKLGTFRRAARKGYATGDFVGALAEIVGTSSAVRWMAGYV